MKTDIYFYKKYEEYENCFKSNRIWRIDGFYEPFVYVIKEIDSGKYYIGSRTVYLSKKSKDSDIGTIYFTSSNHIKKIWKENPNSFEEVQHIKCASNHDAFILELLLIEIHNAVFSDKFINLGHPSIGFDLSGITKTEEHKRKISESNKKSWENFSEEHKEERANINRKRQLERFEDKKEKEKIRVSINKLYKIGHYDQYKESTAKKISDLHKSGHYNEAYQKISEKNKGVKKPDGFGQKLSESKKGWSPSSETRKKMSESRKGKFTGKDNVMSNPESRKKVADSKRGRKRVNKKDGSFIMVKKENIDNYYHHSDGKYYDYEEDTNTIFG